MRLYLSSYKVGNQPQEFLRLLGSNKKIAVVRNAIDFAEPEARKASLERVCDELKNIGLVDIEELDLREYIGKVQALEKQLRLFGGIWIAGGNVFVLKRVVEKSGFDTVIKKLLAEDALVYAGYSAGTVLATPTLKGIELVDDVTQAYYDGKEDFNWEGLGLVPYSIAPHFRSDHHESAAIEKTVAYFEQHKLPYSTLQDGEVIVVDGEMQTVLY